MKNKLTFVGVVMIALLVLLTISLFPTTVNSTQNSTPSFVTSRFMLFGGTYQVDSELQQSSSSTEHGVFKIDTYTGKVWIMKVIESPKKARIEHWNLIESSQTKVE